MRKVKHLTVNLTPILDQDGGQIWWALVCRNLNNGDAIVLLVRHTLGGNMDIRGTCRYAITSSSDLHITPQIYISYEICGARRCSIP